MPSPRTILQKVWDSHTVMQDEASGEVLLYVDRLLLTDTSSFHAFDILRREGRAARNPRLVCERREGGRVRGVAVLLGLGGANRGQGGLVIATV